MVEAWGQGGVGFVVGIYAWVLLNGAGDAEVLEIEARVFAAGCGGGEVRALGDDAAGAGGWLLLGLEVVAKHGGGHGAVVVVGWVDGFNGGDWAIVVVV